MTIRCAVGLAALDCSKVTDLAFGEKERFYKKVSDVFIKENAITSRIYQLVHVHTQKVNKLLGLKKKGQISSKGERLTVLPDVFIDTAENGRANLSLR